MNKATTLLFRTLGVLAGVMGIEHGIGEVSQGYRPTPGLFIESWPDVPFFDIMAGEPAMTLIPNYLITGLLAILLSGIFLQVLLRPEQDTTAMWMLLALLVLMLLAGAGFGPPILGFLALLVALKRSSPLRLWNRLPGGLHRVLRILWPWSFAVCLLGWLMLFPGAALISFFAGVDSEWLMLAPILVAFGSIPITLLLGFSRDIRSPARHSG